MPRKVRRVPVDLDCKGIRKLPLSEIEAVLRGADELIMKGGRTLLAKILRGSREKKILELGLDQCPVHAFYRGRSLEEVLARIDWCILHDYLRIEYDYRLPMLVHSPRGWEITKQLRVAEFLAEFDRLRASGVAEPDLSWLKDRDRGMILLLLQTIEESGDPGYIPILKAWEKVDYRKVQQRIRQVVGTLTAGG